MAEPKKDKNIELVIKGVRLSFVHAFTPQKNVDKVTGAESFSYSVSALIPKRLPDGTPNPEVKRIQEAIKQAQENTWPGQKKVIPPERRCMRDGEPFDPDTVDPEVPGSGTRSPLYDGYAGHVYLSANRRVKEENSPNPVKIIGPKKTAKDAQGRPIFPRLTEADGMIYSGAYGNVCVRIYGYDGSKDGNPDRVNASLEIIQFVRHGEAFGAKPVDADAVMDEEDDEDGFGGNSSPSDDMDEI